MGTLLFVICNPEPMERCSSLHVAARLLERYTAWNPQDRIATLDLYSDYIQAVDADVLWGLEKIGSHGELASLTDRERGKISRIQELAAQFHAADKYLFVTQASRIGIPSHLQLYADGISFLPKVMQVADVHQLEHPDGGKRCLHFHGVGIRHRESEIERDLSSFRWTMKTLGLANVESIVVDKDRGEEARGRYLAAIEVAADFFL